MRYDTLTPSQQSLLRRYIVQYHLDISLKEAIISSPLHSSEIVERLQVFVAESKTVRPQLTDMIYGWLLIIFTFALPIYASYHVSDWLQQRFVSQWIGFLSQSHLLRSGWLQHILFGDYGVISLGTYSFVWALPVVIMISLSTAFIDLSDLKEYIIWSIEPTIMRMGLNGSDIVPLLEGFGCNAAAVAQAHHQCHLCTKAQCMSLISFGTSCSYQIGATLSIFNATHRSWLFLPYLTIVFIGGLIHNKLWLKNDSLINIQLLPKTRTIRWPKWRLLLVKLWSSIQMFVIQALPIFIGICLVVSILSLTPVLELISKIFTPILILLDIPTQLSPGILFSMIRKDGMLLFNMDDSRIIQSLTTWQLLLLVFFSSTFTACSVTMTMIIRQLGWIEGVKLTIRQMVTSASCIILLGIVTLGFTSLSQLGVKLWKLLSLVVS